MPNWFVAISVPAGDWFSRIGEPPPGVRAFHPDDLHLTVAFLGAVGEERAEAAFAAASGWATGPLDVTLGAVEAMGNPRRPSALSARIEHGADTIAAAIAAVRGAICDAAGIATETRDPLPHVTVARPLRSAPSASRRAGVEWALGLDLGAPRVSLSRIALYTRSDDRQVRLFREHRARGLVALR